MSNTNEPQETRHAATGPEQCYVEQKYGWRLIDVEATGNEILEVDCVFKGDVKPAPSPLEPLSPIQVPEEYQAETDAEAVELAEV